MDVSESSGGDEDLGVFDAPEAIAALGDVDRMVVGVRGIDPVFPQHVVIHLHHPFPGSPPLDFRAWHHLLVPHHTPSLFRRAVFLFFGHMLRFLHVIILSPQNYQIDNFRRAVFWGRGGGKVSPEKRGCFSKKKKIKIFFMLLLMGLGDVYNNWLNPFWEIVFGFVYEIRDILCNNIIM